VVDCDVAVITNVDMDHTNELGDTLEAIAGEKVEIINEGCMVVTAEQRRDLLMLIAEKCEDAGAELRVFGRDFRIDYYVPYMVAGETPSQFISVRGLEAREFKDIKLPMIGKHQAVNSACAIVAAQGYTEPRKRTDTDAFKRALEKSRAPGRIEIVGQRPLVVMDGAHNVHAADRLAITLTGEFDYDRLIIVVSILDDKDARGIIKILGAVADEIIVTENRNHRAISARRLAAYCRIAGAEPLIEPDFSEAVKLAYQRSGLNGMICITGSLYTVSEARIYFKHQKVSREMKQDR
ncbi:MAG: hypothetical protein JW738_08745, partial [Actinobacteria bacterium]|nr:hypothetical protein [Actinomycetota bacterium]